MQDFPLLPASSPKPSSTFENDLIQFLDCVARRGLGRSSPAGAAVTSYINKLSLYDFSSAEVELVGTVPGKHRLCQYGGTNHYIAVH